MNKDILKAKDILTDGYTCVLVKDDVIYTSKETGIMPMMNFIGKNTDLNGFSVADKIVGKAVAMLFVFAGIKEVFTDVLSTSALDVLTKNNIKVSYNILTEKIINRLKTGICPMEIAVSNTDSPSEAYQILKQKISKK